VTRFNFLAIILCLSLITACSQQTATTSQKQTTFERVLATKTIRCGYFTWPTYIDKDPNTGKLSGINYDIMEAIGKNLGLKIDWSSEVGVGDVATALNTNKFDAMCITVWPSPGRTQSLTLATPSFYNVAYAYVRAGDTRFDGDLSKANNPNIKVSGIDGDYSYDLAAEKLPQAKQMMLPQTASGSEILLQVVSKKADIVFVDTSMVEGFMKENPNSLQQVAGIGPVRYYGEMLSVKQGEWQLRDMLNIAIQQLINDGDIEKLVSKYRTEYNSTFYAPTPQFNK
jgi:ABC-type amino acid transport substrate-binding protein